MERFSNLMDDLKDAVTLSYNNKSLFLPALIANIIIFIIGVAAAIFFVVTIIGTLASLNQSTMDGVNWQLIIVYILVALVIILFFSIVMIALDIGISGLVIGVVDGDPPSGQRFFSTIKEHLLPVFLTKFALVFIYAFAFLLLVIPLVLYLITVGILTGGWGMLFLTCALQTLLGYWVLIKIEDHRGGFNSIGINIRFGRQNFWLIILVIYIQYCMTAFLPNLLGLIGAALASFFISYLVITVMKIVLLKSYRRYNEITD